MGETKKACEISTKAPRRRLKLYGHVKKREEGQLCGSNSGVDEMHGRRRGRPKRRMNYQMKRCKADCLKATGWQHDPI